MTQLLFCLITMANVPVIVFSMEIFRWKKKEKNSGYSFRWDLSLVAKVFISFLCTNLSNNFEDVEYVTIDIFLCYTTLNEQQLEAGNVQIK